VVEVYVSTDDAKIAAEAWLHGAQVIDRPTDISGDTASSEAGWLHGLEHAQTMLGPINRAVFLQCTSPFTTGADIEACLAAQQTLGADCALSVVSDHSFLWGLDEDGFGIGINHNESKQRQRRQDLPPSFCESGAIYCVNVAAFQRTGQRFCGTVALSAVDHPPVEIDTLDDLALCSRIAQTRGAPELTDRLQAIRAVVMDFDGVHTDNLVLTDQNGVETVRTSRGDGMGLGLLREAGKHHLMILSKERNPVVMQRAKKLQIEVSQSVDDKVGALKTWLEARDLNWENLLYVGNDINDLGAMKLAGVSACPSDSHPSALVQADWILPHPGGQGALRSICDALLALPK
jgi:N-acylneuraminate cytidylyltransferase